MRSLGPSILLWLSVTAVGPAQAHPHVFVDAAIGVSFGEHGLEAVHLAWTFDERFSASLLFQFNRDGSGGFSPTALTELERRHVSGLEPLGYMVDLEADGAALPVRGMRDFRASVDGERVVYRFTLVVSPPASAGGVVRINLDDPGFYTAFTLADAVSVDAAGPYEVECRLARDAGSRRPDGVRCVYRRRVP